MSFTFKVSEIRIIVSNSRISSLIFSSLVTVSELFALFGLYKPLRLINCKYCQFPMFLCFGTAQCVIWILSQLVHVMLHMNARFQSKLQIIMKRLYVNRSNSNLIVIHCLVQRLLAIGASYHTLINLINKKKIFWRIFQAQFFVFSHFLDCSYNLLPHQKEKK